MNQLEIFGADVQSTIKIAIEQMNDKIKPLEEELKKNSQEIGQLKTDLGEKIKEKI